MVVYTKGQHGSKGKDRLQVQRVRWGYVLIKLDLIGFTKFQTI